MAPLDKKMMLYMFLGSKGMDHFSCGFMVTAPCGMNSVGLN